MSDMAALGFTLLKILGNQELKQQQKGHLVLPKL